MTIRLAQQDDAGAIRHFWYQIYVQEMGRHKADAVTDHVNEELTDSLQDVADILIATDANDHIQGTLALTQVNRVQDKKYRELYGLDELSSDEQEHSVITTKLMVREPLRKSRLPLKLVTEGYRHCLAKNYRWNFIDCNDHLVDFFKRLGFVTHRGQINHADYGDVYSLRMNLQDSVHLRQTNSPFYRPCIAHRITVDSLEPIVGENAYDSDSNPIAAQSA